MALRDPHRQVAGVWRSATTHAEFGVRLAISSAPHHLLTRVLGEGAVIARGILSRAIGGILLAGSSEATSGRSHPVCPTLSAALVLNATQSSSADTCGAVSDRRRDTNLRSGEDITPGFHHTYRHAPSCSFSQVLSGAK